MKLIAWRDKKYSGLRLPPFSSTHLWWNGTVKLTNTYHTQPLDFLASPTFFFSFFISKKYQVAIASWISNFDASYWVDNLSTSVFQLTPLSKGPPPINLFSRSTSRASMDWSSIKPEFLNENGLVGFGPF